MIQSCRKTTTMLAILTMMLCSSLAGAQSFVWRNDWTVQLPVGAVDWNYYGSFVPQGPVVFGSDGDLLMRAASGNYDGDQIVRFTSTGAVRWSRCAGWGTTSSRYAPRRPLWVPSPSWSR